ncbi:hypothetical protein [Nocardia wallacei]|uniref:hypothetical protein n=1 Tax=Nocardia wallacei TaxID=480035 RepID=UPI002456C2C9|nr:hypothetical protein [Nocardia wallacei]
MDLPARRDDENARQLGLAPENGPCAYLHHDDGTWSFVGDDGWPVSPEEYAELDADVANALAAVSDSPVDEDLLLRVRHGLLNTIDVDPISVTDTPLWRELER